VLFNFVSSLLAENEIIVKIFLWKEKPTEFRVLSRGAAGVLERS